MVSAMDDDTVELPEYFTVGIASVDRPDVVVIGSPNTTVITIEDNNGVFAFAMLVFVYVCVCVCLCMNVYS